MTTTGKPDTEIARLKATIATLRDSYDTVGGEWKKVVDARDITRADDAKQHAAEIAKHRRKLARRDATIAQLRAEIREFHVARDLIRDALYYAYHGLPARDYRLKETITDITDNGPAINRSLCGHDAIRSGSAISGYRSPRGERQS